MIGHQLQELVKVASKITVHAPWHGQLELDYTSESVKESYEYVAELLQTVF